MADISLTPGELNITYMSKGYPISFQTVHDGNITADTFVASIKISASVSLPIAIVKTYNSTTQKTTLSYNLTAENSALLPFDVVTWKLIQTSGGVSRPLIIGTWGAY
jgi:hypothetical protein